MNQREKIADLYRKHGGDRNAVARELGISVGTVGELTDRVHVPLMGVTYIDDCWPRPATLGRPRLRQYMISSRHVSEIGWPRKDRGAIEAARASYDAGTHELCQGREGSFMVLYSIPRRKRDRRVKYFAAERVL